MPLAWAHAEFVKLLISRQINRPFDRPRAMWQRYRARRPVATHAFWWPHAPIGAMRAGATLAVALPFPPVVRWGRDGWQQIDERRASTAIWGSMSRCSIPRRCRPAAGSISPGGNRTTANGPGATLRCMVRGPEAGGPVGAA